MAGAPPDRKAAAAAGSLQSCNCGCARAGAGLAAAPQAGGVRNMVYDAEGLSSCADARAADVEWRTLATGSREVAAEEISEHTSERKRSTLKRASHSRRPFVASRLRRSGLVAKRPMALLSSSAECDVVSNP